MTGPPGANTLSYTGREDDGTGLKYYRARYYHPGLQRFVNEDPIGFLGGDVNLYVYVQNEPINHLDPWGLISIPGTPFRVFGGGVGETIGGATGAVIGGRVGSGLGIAAGMKLGFAYGAVLGLGGGPLGSMLGGIVGGAVGGVIGGGLGGLGGGIAGGAIGSAFDRPCSGVLNCGETIWPPAHPTGCGRGKCSGP